MSIDVNSSSTLKKKEMPLILGASIGNCVHIAGVANFLRLAKAMGFRTVLLGAAIPPKKLIEAIDKMNPKVVGISYRLTPEVGDRILKNFLNLLGQREVILIFGGTPRMVEVSRKTKRFKFFFIGDEPIAQIERMLRIIRGDITENCESEIIQDKLSVIGKLKNLTIINHEGYSIPLIRHHFGLPNLEKTIKGVSRIAEAKVLDVISLAPDQNAQQFFFRPHQMNPELEGAGGVPLRNPEDLRRIRKAADRGNYPMLRIYAGTQDLLKWAEMSVRELNNAWGAIPLFWYSELDGRSQRKLEEAIRENQKVIHWYAEKGLPLEMLEAHQWSLRDSPDSVAVASAYIGAYNAKSFGVRNFIAQYMFNNPRFTSPLYDLAKMTAKLVLIESLRSESFSPWRQVRPGLNQFSADPYTAKGQLASAIMNTLGIRPHILHVVSFTEADYAAGSEEVIESCKIVQGILKNAFLGLPDPLKDERILIIRKKLLEETSWLLGTLYNLGKYLGAKDPFLDPETLSTAVKIGILDAPHLKGQSCAVGKVETMPRDGGCKAIDPITRKVLPEKDRLFSVLKNGPIKKIIGPSAYKLVEPWELPKTLKTEDMKMIEKT